MNTTDPIAAAPVARLDPRTILFVIGIHAHAAAQRPGIDTDTARALTDLAEDTTETARFSTWYLPHNLYNPGTLTLTAEHQATAASYGLPTGEAVTAAFLRHTATLYLRTLQWAKSRPRPVAVTFTADHFGTRLEWCTASSIRHYANGTTLTDFWHLGCSPRAVLAALMAMEPATVGDTLTLHVDPLNADPIPADTSVYDGMPGEPFTGDQLRHAADVLTTDTYVIQLRSGGAWHLPNHDDPATLRRGEAAKALRYLRDYNAPARFTRDTDGTVYASNGRRAARFIPAALIPGHSEDFCPGCNTPYAVNGDGPCGN